MANPSPYSSAETITTTARREIQVLSRTKSIWVTVAVLLLAVLGMIGFSAWKSHHDDSSGATSVAVVGVPASAFDGSGFGVRESADRPGAEGLVRGGDVDAAVVAGPQGWEVLQDGDSAGETVPAVEAVASRFATTQALASLGVSPEQFASALPDTTVTAVDVSDGGGVTDADLPRLLTALVAMMVIVFTVILFAANIGSRVTAEKSSRVVELVLAAVRPMDFLAGKIIGNVVFGFVLTALILGVGAVGLAVSGLVDRVEVSWSILPVLLLAWLLAMLFFGALYAAAGAMVQRTEDLQSTQAPILFLLIASMYVPMFGWMHTSATWIQVLSWIPPFSIFTAPITYAGGNLSLAQLLGSYALALAATVAAMWLAARIYRSTILNNGRRMSWVEALRA